MKILKILGALISVVVLLVAGAFFYLNHYVQSPEFKQALVSSARNALHTDVKINDVNFSLTSGVTLRGVAIANPPGFDGDLLTASLFVLRYQLGPLLNKRL